MGLVERHVELFNAAVRSGDFAPMLEHFTDDAELAFEGVPVGPFHGRDAIADAYAVQPPDDELELLGVEAQADTIVAPYSWRADGGKRSGRMIVTPRDGKIARLVVTFE